MRSKGNWKPGERSFSRCHKEGVRAPNSLKRSTLEPHQDFLKLGQCDSKPNIQKNGKEMNSSNMF